MQTPIRKSGKHTHTKLDPHLTQEKIGELKKKLTRLREAQPQAITEIKRLAEMGDFSENAAYAMAKGRLRSINQRILELEDQLKNAEIITSAKGASTVQLGHRVTVEIDAQRKTFQVLGSTETNPGQGVISHHSPLGAALMGHRVGDHVTYRSATKSINCQIVKIE